MPYKFTLSENQQINPAYKIVPDTVPRYVPIFHFLYLSLGCRNLVYNHYTGH